MIEVPIEEAVDLIPDRCSLGIGGVLLKRKPMAILAELARAERTSIEAMTFLGSIDIELLASAGTIDTFSGGYVGFEHLGFAPAFTSAVAEGRIGYREHSEYLFMSGLRAAVAGVPFMPTKGAMGSELVTELGLVEIDDPYTGSPVIAVPAISPEVTVIHAEASDHDGNIGASTTADFLSDFDSTIARASTQIGRAHV